MHLIVDEIFYFLKSTVVDQNILSDSYTVDVDD